ncbi:MAG: amidohydrolase [Candidatus Krumholzibacteriota bacterium]|nr:amidohydrolase [Candidatus Krumholzibacteriota bacterium]
MNKKPVVCACACFFILSLLPWGERIGIKVARSEEKPGVETIYYNSRIYTMDEDRPVAQALAVGGGRILAVGGTEEILSRFGSGAGRHDLKGLTMIPGLIDAHAHFSGYALGRAGIDLTGTGNLDEILEKVKARVAATAAGKWIKGRGWDQNDWPRADYPHKYDLDRISGGNPVYLVRVCGHAALANSVALEIAGITARTPDPDGGKIMRDEKGEPTGILIDEAMTLVRAKIPVPTREEKKSLFIRAAHECLAVGLTGIQEMGIGSETASIYRELFAREMLPLRLTVYYTYDEEDLDSLLEAGLVEDFAEYHYAVAGVKFFSDGSLGARSAALLEDYSDDPGNRGLLVLKPEELFRRMLDCHRRGFPIAIHAIGDRGNRISLDVFEKIQAVAPFPGLRHRIEHAQVVSPDDIGRFASLGITPSMQFTHCTSDMPWAPDRLGPERIKGAYRWRSFLEAGCRIPGGSDFPVESIDPLRGIYAAVTRKDREGNPEEGWMPEQCLTVEEAVRAFTLDAAWAVRQEGNRGSLEEGKLADFIILSDDIMSVSAPEILRIDILTTVLGGDVVYRAENSPL